MVLTVLCYCRAFAGVGNIHRCMSLHGLCTVHFLLGVYRPDLAFLCVGAAVGVPLTDEEACLCMVSDMKASLSPLATAYARARGMLCCGFNGLFVASRDDNMKSVLL